MSRWIFVFCLVLVAVCASAAGTDRNQYIERGFDALSNTPRMHIFDFSSNNIQGQKNYLATPVVFIPSINSNDYTIEHNSVVLRPEVLITRFYNEWNIEEMSFDGLFSKIVELLPREIKQVADRQLYRDFVRTFGTHALNNCSFGGKAIVSLHIPREYFNMKTELYITKQAKAFVTRRIFGLIAKDTETEFIDPEFIQNIFVDIEFEGGNESALENEWVQTLNENTAKNLQCDGVYIYEVVEDALVQKNLKTVVDQYLGKQRMHVRAGELSLPGIDKFGFGLDITNGLNRLNVIDFEYTQGQTWTTYKVPDGCTVGDADLSSLRGTWVFKDVNEFVQWQAIRAATSPSGGVFSQTEEVKAFINQYFDKMNSHTVSLDYVPAYSIKLTGQPKLHSFFQAAIDSMPSSYSDVYKKYVGDGYSGWGTHYSYEAVMGGMARYDAYYSSCIIKAQSIEYLTKQGGIQFGIMSNKNSWTSSSEDIDQYYERNAMSVASFIGGNSVLSPSQWGQWKTSVPSNPERIYFKLNPIADLIEDPVKKGFWNQAVNEIEQAAAAKAEQQKIDNMLKPKLIIGGLETRDPNTVVTLGSSSARLGPGQNFSPATYHASLVCSRDSQGQLIAGLTRNQQPLIDGFPVTSGCAIVEATFTVDTWTVRAKGYCCFPPTKLANEGGLVVKECELA